MTNLSLFPEATSKVVFFLESHQLDKVLEFRSSAARDTYVKENNITSGKCSHEMNGEKMSDHYFGIEPKKPETQILEHVREQARRAYSGISFSPEKRAQSIVTDYSLELSADLETMPQEAKQQYQDKYTSMLKTWLSAQGRCISVMITGASNFPVRRNEKANNSEHKRYEEFREWRERALKAINKQAQPEKTFGSELERYQSELEACKKNHEHMKEGNKKIKEALKNKVNIDAYLMEEFGIKPHMLDWAMKFGFGLSNNLANIKRLEERIKLMSSKAETAATTGNKEINFEGGKVILNYEIDRVQIKHDSKPQPEVITALKRNTFKWSPSQGVWQRQLTLNALCATEQLTGLKLR